MATIFHWLIVCLQFTAVVLLCVSCGLPTWQLVSGGSVSSVGLWAAWMKDGSYEDWNELLSHCAPIGCPQTSTWSTAGQTGGAFVILSILCATASLVLNIMSVIDASCASANRKTIYRATLITTALAFFFSWFAWALWSSLRVFGVGPFGFGLFACVIAYCFLGAATVLLGSLRSADEYRPIDDEPASLQQDYPLPPYKFHAFEIPIFSKWASVGAARILFFFLCIYAFVNYMSSITDSNVGSAQDFWSRLILGIIYLVCFVLASRIICELVLVIFVVKDRYMQKDLASLRKAPEQSQDFLSREVTVSVEVSSQQPANSNSGGSYQAL